MSTDTDSKPPSNLEVKKILTIKGVTVARQAWAGGEQEYKTRILPQIPRHISYLYY